MRTTTLIKKLRPGECITFDQGRICVQFEEKSGRNAKLRVTLAEDAVVDKPRIAANDEGGFPRGALNSEK